MKNVITLNVKITNPSENEWICDTEEEYCNCHFNGYGETKEIALIDFGMCISDMLYEKMQSNEVFPYFKFNIIDE